MKTSIVPFSAELAESLLNSSEQFPVDFDMAWVWLGYTRRDNAVRKLKGFKEGFDLLKVEEVVNRVQGGTTTVHRYFLTVDCFKMLGMLAQTEQGDRVRQYFLECERIAKREPAAMSIMDMIIASAQAHKALEQRQAAMEQLLRDSIAQKDEEIALLKSTMETIDMETQANTAELDRFRNGHGYYFSIAGWCTKNGLRLSLKEMELMGRKASAMCKQQNIRPEPVSDPRWGTVNTYPDRILMELV